ncbi:tetratricopeptide repeat protein [Planctomycetaceae bacterium SH139]
MTQTALSDNEKRQQSQPGLALIIGVTLMLSSFWMFVWRGSLDGVFHFDDYGNIVDNERIRQLWPLDNFLHNNRPVGLYSFAINYYFSGAEPYAYHVVNLVIHLTNGFLLIAGCLLTWRLYHKYWKQENQPQVTYSALLMAGFISTAWVVHPLTTQAVTNVVQRYESLASMGYLGVWVGMLFVLDGRKWLGCAIILPMAWIGLMSKEIFASAPLAVLLFDCLVTRDMWRGIVKRRWLPYALLLSPYIWFMPSVLRWFDPVRTAESSMGIGLKSISPWQYLRTQPEVIWHYLGLTVWPKQLCFDYVWRIQDNPWIYLSLGASLLGLIGFAAVAYTRCVAKNSKFGFGLTGWLILTFFLILAPTSSIMPIADIAFEHRMYLPSAVVIAGIGLLGWCVVRGLLRNAERPAVLGVAFVCTTAAFISLLSWRTHIRNLDYRDGLILWQTAADASPKNPRAWYHIGREHIQRGDRKSALKPMVKAVGYSNVSVPLYDIGLADCLQHIERHEDAITLLMRALAKTNEYPEVHNDLGAIYLKMNRLDDAELAFKVAVDMEYATAKYNLALVYSRQGKIAQAIDMWEETLVDTPSLVVAVRQLAWTLATTSDSQLRDVDRAEQLLREHYHLDQNPQANSQADYGSPQAASERGAGSKEQSTQLLMATQSAYTLDAWAAILAAKGEYEAATQVATQALTLAKSKPNELLIPELTKRLTGYQRGEPCIDGVQP